MLKTWVIPVGINTPHVHVKKNKDTNLEKNVWHLLVNSSRCIKRMCFFFTNKYCTVGKYEKWKPPHLQIKQGVQQGKKA